MTKGQATLLIVVGCILLTVANLSLWITRDILDSARFGQLVTEGLQSDQATEALSTLIMDHILDNRPKLPSFVRLPAEEFVSGLMQRPILTPLLEKAAAAVDTVVMGGLEDEISIDLESVIPFVVSLVTTIDPELADGFENVRESAPVKLLGPGELPKLRQAAKILPWLWPLTALGAFALYALAYWRAQNRRDTLLSIGLGVVITGLIGLLFIPAIRLTVENNVVNSSVRLIAGAVMAVFTRGYFIQTVILIVIGLVIIVASRYLLKDAGVVN